MKTLLLLCAFATATLAQPISLDGAWKMHAGDNPQWSQPNSDDHDWPAVTLPLRALDTGVFWLRRTVPTPSCGGDCYVTIGLISEVYELYVNGVNIGGTSPFTSSELHYPQPRAFRIPGDVLHRESSVTLALRVRGSHMMWGRTGQGISERDPYWLSGPEYASAAVEAARNRMRLQISPSLANVCVQLGIGLCLLLLWLGERQRLDLLFFAGYLLGQSLVESIGIFVVSVGGSSLWTFLVYRPCNLVAFLLLVAALRIIFRLGSFRVWAVGGTAVVSLALDILFPYTILFLAPWYAALAWLCLGAVRSSVRENVWIVVPCVCYVAAGLNNLLPAPHLFPLAFAVGDLTLSLTSLSQSALGASMLILLLRRLSQDRREKLRLDSEIEAARGIQQLLLSATPAPSANSSVDAVYLPAQEVGGDFYQVVPLADGELLVAVGDVSGKGLKAAMVVSMLVGVLRSHTHLSPSALLAQINRALVGSLDGGFVTCIAARIDRAGRCVLANAGHPEPYADGCEVALDGGLPLGVTTEADYTETDIRATSLTFVSDGVVEAANAQRELFGFERTRSISVQPAREIAEAARAWGQNDDITVVTVRRQC
ncbi:MAG TPA: SpoIIE family protein phosphatase [Bryobacteraceae bacterium]|nr:SpoIIE family protein phosphatase [Bryobacteraceae bacterium]